MSSLCNRIQDRLAEHGPEALQADAASQEHLVECEECYTFLEALGEVDAGIDALPLVDAPDGLVARTQRVIESERSSLQQEEPAERSQPSSSRGFRWPLSPVRTLGTALAATLVLATSWSVLEQQGNLSFVRLLGESESTLQEEVAQSHPTEIREEFARADEDASALAPQSPSALQDLRERGYMESGAGVASADPKSQKKELAENAPAPASPAPPAGSDNGALSELAYRESQSLSQRANETFGYLDKNVFADHTSPDQPLEAQLRSEQKRIASLGQSSRAQPAPPRRRAGRKRSAVDAVVALPEAESVVGDFRKGELDALGSRAEGRLAPKDAPGKAGMPTHSPAERFAGERRQLDKLNFQSASGYWENTYVPGDPVMRWLESRLAKSDRAQLQAVSAGAPLRLESAARQTSQAFDAPTNAALSVFLHADQRGLEGEKRMLVQVGLRGADRHSRLRPAMNIGVVLDLRGPLATETAVSMRALVHALLAAKDVGDHFSLSVAGRPGGTWVSSDEFRHGPITLALARLEGSAPADILAPSLNLEQAVQHAIAETKSGDDPNAPLGSSMVLLVTAQSLANALSPLETIAHQSAVDGVPLSVVGVGDGASLDEIDRLALAGQGNRRLLQTPLEAESLVARELSSLSQVIARALRLRIRLAPGVKLVEVVGSQRLDQAGAARVRQAEKSIDRRLARNFGIEADRGDDEEGIQIVIPTFRSGVSHSVVLDVVAPGPGPIADVTLRYKDLVFLRNGVARANLTLGRETAAPGPLERNVVKSYLAIALSDTLKQAGRALLTGEDASARALIQDFRELLASLTRELPGYQNDADLATDLAMLDEYLGVLDTGVLAQSDPRRTLAESLQLSGYFKTVPRSHSDPVHARVDLRR